MKKREFPTSIRFDKETKELLDRAVKNTGFTLNRLVNHYVTVGAKKAIKLSKHSEVFKRRGNRVWRIK